MDVKQPEVRFAMVFVLAYVAGVVRQLSMRRRRSCDEIIIGGAWSGVFGLGVAMYLHESFPDEFWKPIGIIVLASLGGATSFEEVLAWGRAGLRVVELTRNAKNKETPGASSDK